MLQLAKRGAPLIVGVGFGHQAAMTKVAAQYPKIRFTIVDAVVDLPNVQSIVFREQECCFLVGMIAALTSKTGKIGFVGGMDVPLIRRFAAGYAEGAKFAKPDVEVLQTMTGTTVSAWNDPARGSELARSQFDRGADVVFAAAGATGIGVLQAAADAKKILDRLRLEPECAAPGLGLDFDGEARRCRDLQRHDGGQGRQVATGQAVARPQGRRARLRDRRQQPLADHAGDQGARRPGQGGDHRRQARSDRRRGPINVIMDGAAPAIAFDRITKRFGAVVANRGVSFEISAGTIHGIIGENGAGKSTLMSILYGFYQADDGEIRLGGRPARIANTADAIRLGIGMVHQHFVLVEPFTVLETWRSAAKAGSTCSRASTEARTAAREIEAAYGLAVDLDARVEDLR